MIVCRGCPVRADRPSRRFDATFPRPAAMKISIAGSPLVRATIFQNHRQWANRTSQLPGLPGSGDHIGNVLHGVRLEPASQVIPARPLGVGQRYAVQRQGTPATPR